MSEHLRATVAFPSEAPRPRAVWPVIHTHPDLPSSQVLEPVPFDVRRALANWDGLSQQVRAWIPGLAQKDRQAFNAAMHEVLDELISGRRTFDGEALLLASLAATVRALPGERDRNELDSVTWHEAGHCAAAILCGVPVTRVTNIPPPIGTSSGCVTLARGAPTIAAWTSPERMDLEHFAMIDLAGCAAEDQSGRAAGRENWERHRGDARKTLLPLRPWCGEQALTAHIALLELRARGLIATHWPAVEALHSALLDRGTISGRRAAAIVRRAERGHGGPR